MPQFRIYLAGPISGCNEQQRDQWRKTIKEDNSRISRRCEFSDPVDELGPGARIPHEVVAADIRAIEDADGVLVNMWRESIGTAIAVSHAYHAGRPVVVSDPNHLSNRALAFYADAVVDDPRKGLKVLVNLLGAESWRVSKRHGLENFSRSILLADLRNVCRQAKSDDIVIPRLVVPLVIARLSENKTEVAGAIPAGTNRKGSRLCVD